MFTSKTYDEQFKKIKVLWLLVFQLSHLICFFKTGHFLSLFHKKIDWSNLNPKSKTD